MTIIDSVCAYQIEVGDQIIVDGDPVEVTRVYETSDLDEVVISGYSHETGDRETYSLYADDVYDVWAV